MMCIVEDAAKTTGAFEGRSSRPYPSQYVTSCSLRDGMAVTVRPIRQEGEPSLVKFHEDLSDRSVTFRYFHSMNLGQRTAHERLARICLSDFDKDMVLVAEGHRVENNERIILGIGRLGKLTDGKKAEFAIVVSDRWQNRGLGTELLKRLLQVARGEKIERVFATILAQNLEMQRIAEKLGFKLDQSDTVSEVHASIDLV
jgi:acetyltransferase